MKRFFGYVLTFVMVIFLQTSCVKGCIDDNALNYDPEATLNKGCLYPETINIISVGVKFHPSEDNSGIEWDLDGSGPDKFIKIINDGTNALLYTTEVETFTPVSWTLSPEIFLKSNDLVLRFELYDQDGMEEVLMDQATLDVESLTGTTAETSNDLYPESGTFSGNNGTSFTISMNWTE